MTSEFPYFLHHFWGSDMRRIIFLKEQHSSESNVYIFTSLRLGPVYMNYSKKQLSLS